MKMKGQVGYWGSCETGGLVIGFSHEMVRWLDAQHTDRRVFVSVDKNRQVIVLPDADGGMVQSAGQHNMLPYRYCSGATRDSLIMDKRACLPVFGLKELDFDMEAGCLSTFIPEADYELPWPYLDLECKTYDPAQVAKEALQVRLNSLAASGLTSFPMEHRMPIRLRRLLPDGAWAECLSLAKTLSGVSQ
jgi:hypothetical protein